MAQIIYTTKLSGRVRNRTATYIIPRTNSNVSVSPPFVGYTASLPASELAGSGMNATVLVFDPAVTGQLIKTQDYEQGITFYHNDGAGKPCQSVWVHDLAIDGRAQLHNYPYVSNLAPGLDDPYGPDFVPTADGICCEGSGTRLERILLFAIPGKALILKSGSTSQSGAKSIWDEQNAYVSDVFVFKSYAGPQIILNDAQLRNVNVSEVVTDGFTLDGPGTYLTDCHVWGADRGCVVSAKCYLSGCYFESARIGLEIASGGSETQVSGLEIGPSTCWYRGVLINPSSCEVTGLTGSVAPATVDHPDIAGLELAVNTANEYIQGHLTVGNGSTGFILRGHHNRLIAMGGWGSANTSTTFVKASQTITGTTIEITGGGTSGVVLDLSSTTLNSTNGAGNKFVINWNDWIGDNKRIKYPGGGYTYNLAAGNQVWVDGVLLT